MQRGCEPRGQGECLIFNVGLGLRLLTPRTQRAQRNYRCRNAGGWPYYGPHVRAFEGRPGRAIFFRGCGHDAGTGQGSQGFNGWSARAGGVTVRVRSLAEGIEAGREDLLWR